MQFQSPDTVIPDLYNPLDLNRYGYARYNPLKYTDPTGHVPVGDIYGHSSRDLLRFQNLRLKDDVERTLQNYARQVANALANMLNRVNRYMYYSGETASLSKYSSDAAFDFVYGGPILVEGDATIDSPARAHQDVSTGANWIKVNPNDLFISNHPRIIVHEMGHVFNNVMGKSLEAQIPQSQVREDGNYSGPNNDYYGYAGGQWDWQFSLSTQLHQKNEIFAENFLGWTFNQWNVTSSGSTKASFMDYLMFTYLSYMSMGH